MIRIIDRSKSLSKKTSKVHQEPEEGILEGSVGHSLQSE